MKRFCRTAAVLGWVVLCLCSPKLALSDTVTFTNGDVVEGKILSQTDSDYEFEMDGITLWISKSEVESLELDGERDIPRTSTGSAGPVKEGFQPPAGTEDAAEDAADEAEPFDEPIEDEPEISVNPPQVEEPKELSNSEINDVAKNLASDDADERETAFRQLQDGGDKAVARLEKELEKVLKRAEKDYVKALVSASTRGVGSHRSSNESEINSLRSQMFGLMQQQRTKEMKPLYEKLRALWYPALENMDDDQKFTSAHALITWCVPKLRQIDSSLPEPAQYMENLKLEADVDIMMKACPGSEKSAMGSAVKLRKFLQDGEFICTMLTNEYRVMMGLNAVKVNTNLVKCGRMHSKDMNDHNFFDHTSPLPGKTHFRDRSKMFGEGARSENIAMQCATGVITFWGWFESAGHHINMMRKEHKEMGIGQYEMYYTELFK